MGGFRVGGSSWVSWECERLEFESVSSWRAGSVTVVSKKNYPQISQIAQIDK